MAYLSYIANQLQAISNKELTDTILTDEAYKFIKTYGGNIEYFQREAIQRFENKY